MQNSVIATLLCLTILHLEVTRGQGSLPDRAAFENGDFEKYMISDNGEIQKPLVEMFVKITEEERFMQRKGKPNSGKNPFDEIATNIKDRDLRTQLMDGIKTNNAPNILAKTAHHIITWPMISSKLKDIGNAIREETDQNKQNKLYQKLQTGLQNMWLNADEKYKRSTWRAAIKMVKQEQEEQSKDGGKLLTDVIHDVAYEISCMLRWTPNNLFLGPDSKSRVNDDMDGDCLDMEILESLAIVQQWKYPKVKGKKCYGLSDIFNYQESSWNTIVEVLASIDKGPAFQGPVWEKKSPLPTGAKVWIVNKQKHNRICYPNSMSKVNEEMCPQNTYYDENQVFIDVTSGYAYCRRLGEGTNPVSPSGQPIVNPSLC